ncbi:MAG: hypothetical protein ACD_51C00244G0002 [uncultured bacterium]|nr:MAG: hypothetical protein ACD_51C00244G0002 [uncultured bacterium]
MIYIVMFAIGIAFGSFLSMLIPRIYKSEKGMFFGRSHCFSCKKTLKALDLIPVFSYLWNRAKCRFCGEKIPHLYLLIELATGLIFVLTYHFFRFETPAEAPLTIYYLIMGLALVFTFFYDLKYLEISDLILVPGIVLGLAGALVFEEAPGIVSALIGAVIGAGFFLAQFLLSKGKWVGGGDFRIGAFMGALLGWQMTLTALAVSYVIGSMVSIPLLLFGKKKMKEKIALGPFLVAGTFVALFAGESIFNWYFNLI